MRRAAALLVACVGALAVLAPAAIAAGTEPVVAGTLNNASASLPVGAGGTGMQAGPLSEVQDLAVSGDFAYVPSYFNGTLSAVNLSDPTTPAIDALSSIGTVPSSGTQVVGADTVNVFNGVAYVLSKNLNAQCPGAFNSPPDTTGCSNDITTGNSLTMFDVSGSNADSPAYLGSYTDSNAASVGQLFGAYGVAVASKGGQTYAYVVAQGCLSGQPCDHGSYGNDIVVLNVTDPTSPTYVTTLHNSSTGQWANALHHPTAIVTAGNYAYVTSFYGAQVAVIDISNPSNPTIVATIPNDANNDVQWPNDLAISGHYLLIDNQGSAGPISVVDISNPLAPAIVGGVSSPLLNNAYRIAVSGDFAYVAATSSKTVSAIDISNPQMPRLAGFVTDATNLIGTSGVDVMPTSGGLYLAATAQHQTGESGSNTYPPYPPGIISYPPTPPFPGYGSSGNTDKTGGIAAIQVNPGVVPNSVAITPSSEPPSQTTQTSANFSFSTTDAVATVACSLDGASSGPCGTATTMSYTGLAVGSHTFTVQSTDASGNTTSDHYSWTVLAPAATPANSQRPSITGTAQQGLTLTEVNGTWSNSPTSYAHQWEVCDAAGANCQPISGATGLTYIPTSGDVGHRIVVTETATNSIGTGGPVASSPTQAVLAAAATGGGSTGSGGGSPSTGAAPTIKVKPAVLGTLAVGQTVSASHGTWSGTGVSYAYAWSRCAAGGASSCQNITGATRATYRLVKADAGKRLMVTVTATDGNGSATVASAHTAIVAARSASLAVTITAASGQHVGRSGTLIVHVRCRVSALIGAYARIEVGKGSAFVTPRVMTQAGAGQNVRLTLRLTSAQAARIRAGLRAEKAVAASIFPVRAVTTLRSVAAGADRQVAIVS